MKLKPTKLRETSLSDPGYYAAINVKPAEGGGGGGRRGIGQGFDRSLWPGGRAFELSCSPRGKGI